MKSNGTIRIAIQKAGRLAEGSRRLLEHMGLAYEVSDQALFARCRNMSVDILFLRDDDIPEYVQDGVADLGIVGSNVLEERRLSVERLLPLDFGYCTLSIAVPESEAYQSLNRLQGKRIATSYPGMLKRYLESKGVEAEIILLNGCVEIAPALGVADAICDLVSTGSTLRTNRLRVIERMSESQAVLIGSKNPATKKRHMLENLLMRARGVQEARRYKYVMFNAPEKALTAIKELVPGCKSPTVMRLAEPGWIAVHSVIEEEIFWETVEKIRACGGSGILVSSIEKFIR